jgi:nitroreductase
MPTLPAESILAQLRWRYAVKKFDGTKKIPEATWACLEQAMILSPSSYGLQPWRFVVITDAAVKAKLPAISWNQSQPKDCSHMVVFASRKGINPQDVQRFADRIVQVRGGSKDDPALKGYIDMMLGTVKSLPAEAADAWCSRQVYIALGFLMFAAASQGVDACPMEGIVGAEYDKLLGLDTIGYTATVGCALGYRASDDWLASLPKVRAEAKDVIIRI